MTVSGLANHSFPLVPTNLSVGAGTIDLMSVEFYKEVLHVPNFCSATRALKKIITAKTRSQGDTMLCPNIFTTPGAKSTSSQLLKRKKKKKKKLTFLKTLLYWFSVSKISCIRNRAKMKGTCLKKKTYGHSLS